ncbi:MAG: hypothetical protein COB08_019300 [Rhodobacteraceae bacterium]|nr:hypothetical protein [Paracoccaceae bacterium]
MGNAVIGSLRANLGLDSTKFQKGARGVRDPLRNMKRQFIAVAGAAAVFGGAITTAAMKGAAEIDKVAKSARRLDASIGGFRAITLAADEAGINLSSLTNDVQTLNRELTRAGEGGPVDDALKALGLSAQELLDLDIDERLAMIADRMLELGLTAGKATAILQDFGIRNREMALLMIQGGDKIRSARADMKEYGLVLEQVDSDKIEQANDHISRLSLVSKYFAQQLALEVVPALGQMAKGFTDSLRAGGLLRKMIDGFADNLKRVSTYVGTFVTLLGTRLVFAMGAAAIATGSFSAAILTLRGSLMRLGLPAIAIGIGELIYQFGLADEATDEYAAATRAATEAEAQLRAAVSGTSAVMPAAAQNAVTLAKARVDLANASLDAAIAELEARRAMGEDTANAPDSFFRDVAMALGGASRAGLETEVVDKITELKDAKQALTDTASLAINADYGGAASLVEEADTALQNLLRTLDPTIARSEQYTAAVALLNTELTSGRMTLEEYNANVEKTKQLYGELETAGGGAARSTNEVEEALKKAADAAEETKTAVDGLGSTFASTFADILTGTTSAIAGLAQLAAQLGKMALMKGLEGLFGNLLGGLSGGGAGLASLFGFNANGTDNWQGGLTMVGERGPELANLPSGSQIFNAQKTAQMLSAPAATAPEIKVEPKIINLFDMSLVGDWMAGPDGEAIILNHMARNGVAGA